MTVRIRFRMAYGPSPLTGKPGIEAWCLWREVVESATGITVTSEAVAIFNFDTEAQTFMRFLCDGGLQTAIEVPDDFKELYALQIKNREPREVRR